MAELNSTIIKGNLRVTGTIFGNPPVSGATAGSYGDSSAQTPGHGGTFKVPYLVVDSYGKITGISEHNVTIPSSTASSSGAGLVPQANAGDPQNGVYVLTSYAGNVQWTEGFLTDTKYNFSGTTFCSGYSSSQEHNCNSAVSNGHYYYTSNGPSGLGESTDDGALYVQAYSSSWVAQIAQDYRNGRLWVRGKKDGTWQDWKRIAQYDELPTNTNQLTNGAGFITSSGSCNYANSAGTASTAATASALGVTEAVGGSTQPVYINSSGVPVACSYTIAKSVPSNADFTNTWRPLGTGATDACAGNDSRLSDSRTPTAHASSSTTYGVGTSSNYGHVKIVTGDLYNNNSGDGYAAGANHTHSQYMTTSSAIERLQYTTTVPSSANASGLKVYIGSTNPSTKYSGWLYIITS